jgi:PAS domain S-box-containing protein
MGIRRLLVLFALAILVPMIAFSIIAVVAFDRQQRDIVAGRGVETARALINTVDHQLAGSVSTLEALGTARSLERGDLASFYEDARRVLDSHRGWITLTLISPQGQLVLDLAVPFGAPLPSAAVPETFAAVMNTGAPAVGGAAPVPFAHRFGFPVSVPIVRQGHIIDVLTAVIDPDVIQQILRKQEIPGDWVGTVFDPKRAVVARTRGKEQFVGGFVSDDFARALLTAREGWLVTRSLEGARVYTAFSRSATTGWGVGLGIPREVIDGAVRRSLWTIAGGGAALLVIAGGLALVIGRRLARNLSAVADAAIAIGQRKAVRVPRSSIRELDAVARGLATAGTLRDQAEAALWDNQARLATTLTSIGDAVIATDLDGRVTFMNPVASAMTGWPEAEASGRELAAVFSIVDEHTGQPAGNPVARVLSEGIVVGLANDPILVSRDGRRIPIEDSAAPIRTPDGRITGVVLVFRDVAAKRQAQAEFRLVADAAPVLIWMAGPDARFTFVNQPWLAFTGRSLAQELGDGWTEGIHPNDLARYLDGYRSAFDARQKFETEYRLRRHDGEYRWVLDRGVPRYEPNGRFAGYAGSCIDITDRREAEEARRYLAAIVEGSHDAIASKTLEGIITAWNPGAVRLFGYTAEDAVGRPITIIIPPERLAEERDILARLRRGERIDSFETVRVRKDGTRVEVSLTVSPIRGADGMIIGASKTARDITSAKRLERERAELLEREQAARADAELANRAKDEFLAMLGHELRNPLGAISSAVHVLEHAGGPNAHAAKARDVISRQTAHLARLVDDLLDVGRVMAGKIILNRARVDLAEVVRRSISTLQTAGSLAQHALVLDAEPVWVEADVVRMEQVVGNLLSNAVRYTPPGGRIVVTVTRDESHARMGVEDSGCGIPADLLPRIFDLFVQGTQGSSRTAGGLGVGLTLVRRLVTLHGGTIDAASDGAGLGSTFTVELPAVDAPDAGDGSSPLVEEKGRPRRILIVEDNADSRDILKELLTLEGHQAFAAADGVSALEIVAREDLDVALIDIGLPGLDGYEVARRIRSGARGKDVALVTLTGYGLEADRRRATEAGFDAHLVKPLSRAKLEQILSQIGARSGPP